MKSTTSLALILSCGLVPAVFAQTVWSGAASTTDWLNAQNWFPVGVPGLGTQTNASVLISPSSYTTVLLRESPGVMSLSSFNVPSTLVTTILSGSFVDISGDYTNAGLLTMDPGTFRSQLRIFGTTVSGLGHGEMSLFGGLGNPAHAQLWLMNHPTIAAGMNIHGTASLVGGFTNMGRIAADFPGQDFTIMTSAADPGASIENRGTIAASAGSHMKIYTFNSIDNSGGTISADASTVEFVGGADLTGGTLSTTNGGTILMNAPYSVFESGVRFAGNIVLTETGTFRFNFDNQHPVINNSGVIRITKVTSNPYPATANQRYSTTFTGGGVLSMEGRTSLWSEAMYTENGLTTLTNSSGHTFRGIGTFNPAVVNQGLISVGFADTAPNNDQLTVLQFEKTLTLTSAGTVEISLAANEPGAPASGHLTSNMPLTMNGTLRIVLEGSPFITNIGRTWDLIAAPTLSGAFTSVTYPTLPRGLRWVTSIVHADTMDHLWISITCAADFNGDDSADFFDYLDFVQAFSTNQPEADFNSDGTIDFFDYLDFVDAFSRGC